MGEGEVGGSGGECIAESVLRRLRRVLPVTVEEPLIAPLFDADKGRVNRGQVAFHRLFPSLPCRPEGISE